MKPPRDSSAEDRLELHREKMRLKASRRDDVHRSGSATYASYLRRKDRRTGKVTFARVPPNNGKRNSIWPESKFAKPGRMA